MPERIEIEIISKGGDQVTSSIKQLIELTQQLHKAAVTLTAQMTTLQQTISQITSGVDLSKLNISMQAVGESAKKTAHEAKKATEAVAESAQRSFDFVNNVAQQPSVTNLSERLIKSMRDFVDRSRHHVDELRQNLETAFEKARVKAQRDLELIKAGIKDTASLSAEEINEVFLKQPETHVSAIGFSKQVSNSIEAIRSELLNLREIGASIQPINPVVGLERGLISASEAARELIETLLTMKSLGLSGTAILSTDLFKDKDFAEEFVKAFHSLRQNAGETLKDVKLDIGQIGHGLVKAVDSIRDGTYAVGEAISFTSKEIANFSDLFEKSGLSASRLLEVLNHLQRGYQLSATTTNVLRGELVALDAKQQQSIPTINEIRKTFNQLTGDLMLASGNLQLSSKSLEGLKTAFEKSGLSIDTMDAIIKVLGRDFGLLEDQMDSLLTFVTRLPEGLKAGEDRSKSLSERLKELIAVAQQAGSAVADQLKAIEARAPTATELAARREKLWTLGAGIAGQTFTDEEVIAATTLQPRATVSALGFEKEVQNVVGLKNALEEFRAVAGETREINPFVRMERGAETVFSVTTDLVTMFERLQQEGIKTGKIELFSPLLKSRDYAEQLIQAFDSMAKRAGISLDRVKLDLDELGNGIIRVYQTLGSGQKVDASGLRIVGRDFERIFDAISKSQLPIARMKQIVEEVSRQFNIASTTTRELIAQIDAFEAATRQSAPSIDSLIEQINQLSGSVKLASGELQIAPTRLRDFIQMMVKSGLSVKDMETAFQSVAEKFNLTADQTKFVLDAIRQLPLGLSEGSAAADKFEDELSKVIRAMGGASRASEEMRNRVKETTDAKRNANIEASVLSNQLNQLQSAIFSLLIGLATFRRVFQVLGTEFQKGIEHIKEFQSAFIEVRAVIAQTLPHEIPIQRRLESARLAAREIVPELQRLDAQTLGTFNDLTRTFTALVRNTVPLKDALDLAPILTNAITILTRGQGLTKQLNQEIRALFTDQQVQGADLLRLLEENLGITQEQIKEWRNQGVLITELRRSLEAFVALSEEFGSSLQGVTSSMETLINQVRRLSLRPVADALTRTFIQFRNELGVTTSAVVNLGSLLSNALAPFGETIDRLGKLLLSLLKDTAFVSSITRISKTIFEADQNATIFTITLGLLISTIGTVVIAFVSLFAGVATIVGKLPVAVSLFLKLTGALLGVVSAAAAVDETGKTLSRTLSTLINVVNTVFVLLPPFLYGLAAINAAMLILADRTLRVATNLRVAMIVLFAYEAAVRDGYKSTLGFIGIILLLIPTLFKLKDALIALNAQLVALGLSSAAQLGVFGLIAIAIGGVVYGIYKWVSANNEAKQSVVTLNEASLELAESLRREQGALASVVAEREKLRKSFIPAPPPRRSDLLSAIDSKDFGGLRTIQPIPVAAHDSIAKFGEEAFKTGLKISQLNEKIKAATELSQNASRQLGGLAAAAQQDVSKAFDAVSAAVARYQRALQTGGKDLVLESFAEFVNALEKEVPRIERAGKIAALAGSKSFLEFLNTLDATIAQLRKLGDTAAVVRFEKLRQEIVNYKNSLSDTRPFVEKFTDQINSLADAVGVRLVNAFENLTQSLEDSRARLQAASQIVKAIDFAIQRGVKVAPEVKQAREEARKIIEQDAVKFQQLTDAQGKVFGQAILRALKEGGDSLAAVGKHLDTARQVAEEFGETSTRSVQSVHDVSDRLENRVARLRAEFIALLRVGTEAADVIRRLGPERLERLKAQEIFLAPAKEALQNIEQLRIQLGAVDNVSEKVLNTLRKAFVEAGEADFDVAALGKTLNELQSIRRRLQQIFDAKQYIEQLQDVFTTLTVEAEKFAREENFRQRNANLLRQTQARAFYEQEKLDRARNLQETLSKLDALERHYNEGFYQAAQFRQQVIAEENLARLSGVIETEKQITIQQQRLRDLRDPFSIARQAIAKSIEQDILKAEADATEALERARALSEQFALRESEFLRNVYLEAQAKRVEAVNEAKREIQQIESELTAGLLRYEERITLARSRALRERLNAEIENATQLTLLREQLSRLAQRDPQQVTLVLQERERRLLQERIQATERAIELEDLLKNRRLLTVDEVREAQLEALRKVMDADNELTRRRIENLTLIGTKSILMAEQVNDKLLEHLAQSKSITDIIADAQLTLFRSIETAFDASIEQFSKKFGKLSDFVAQLGKDLVQYVIRQAVQPFFINIQQSLGSIFGQAVKPPQTQPTKQELAAIIENVITRVKEKGEVVLDDATRNILDAGTQLQAQQVGHIVSIDETVKQIAEYVKTLLGGDEAENNLLRFAPPPQGWVAKIADRQQLPPPPPDITRSAVPTWILDMPDPEHAINRNTIDRLLARQQVEWAGWLEDWQRTRQVRAQAQQQSDNIGGFEKGFAISPLQLLTNIMQRAAVFTMVGGKASSLLMLLGLLAQLSQIGQANPRGGVQPQGGGGIFGNIFGGIFGNILGGISGGTRGQLDPFIIKNFVEKNQKQQQVVSTDVSAIRAIVAQQPWRVFVVNLPPVHGAPLASGFGGLGSLGTIASVLSSFPRVQQVEDARPSILNAQQASGGLRGGPLDGPRGIQGGISTAGGISGFLGSIFGAVRGGLRFLAPGLQILGGALSGAAFGGQSRAGQIIGGIGGALGAFSSAAASGLFGAALALSSIPLVGGFIAAGLLLAAPVISRLTQRGRDKEAASRSIERLYVDLHALLRGVQLDQIEGRTAEQQARQRFAEWIASLDQIVKDPVVRERSIQSQTKYFAQYFDYLHKEATLQADRRRILQVQPEFRRGGQVTRDILATPGELIVHPLAVKRLGLSRLSRINEGAEVADMSTIREIYASSTVVPGVGDRDNVPMSPLVGSFVLRKSAVISLRQAAARYSITPAFQTGGLIQSGLITTLLTILLQQGGKAITPELLAVLLPFLLGKSKAYQELEPEQQSLIVSSLSTAGLDIAKAIKAKEKVPVGAIATLTTALTPLLPEKIQPFAPLIPLIFQYFQNRSKPKMQLGGIVPPDILQIILQMLAGGGNLSALLRNLIIEYLRKQAGFANLPDDLEKAILDAIASAQSLEDLRNIFANPVLISSLISGLPFFQNLGPLPKSLLGALIPALLSGGGLKDILKSPTFIGGLTSGLLTNSNFLEGLSEQEKAAILALLAKGYAPTGFDTQSLALLSSALLPQTLKAFGIKPEVATIAGQLFGFGTQYLLSPQGIEQFPQAAETLQALLPYLPLLEVLLPVLLQNTKVNPLALLLLLGGGAALLSRRRQEPQPAPTGADIDIEPIRRFGLLRQNLQQLPALRREPRFFVGRDRQFQGGFLKSPAGIGALLIGGLLLASLFKGGGGLFGTGVGSDELPVFGGGAVGLGPLADAIPLFKIGGLKPGVGIKIPGFKSGGGPPGVFPITPSPEDLGIYQGIIHDEQQRRLDAALQSAANTAYIGLGSSAGGLGTYGSLFGSTGSGILPPGGFIEPKEGQGKQNIVVHVHPTIGPVYLVTDAGQIVRAGKDDVKHILRTTLLDRDF